MAQCSRRCKLAGADKASLKEELMLPIEVYLEIFSYLSPPDLGRLLPVCKVRTASQIGRGSLCNGARTQPISFYLQLWYDIAQDGKLWKRHYRAKWPKNSSNSKEGNAPIEDWYGCWKIRLRYGHRRTLAGALEALRRCCWRTHYHQARAVQGAQAGSV